MMNNWFPKLKPMLGMTSLGGGGTNIALGGAALVQSATGGDKYVEGSYTIHKYLESTPAPESTFVNDGTAAITVSHYIAVGGGGGSNSGHGGAGGGGNGSSTDPGSARSGTAGGTNTGGGGGGAGGTNYAGGSGVVILRYRYQ